MKKSAALRLVTVVCLLASLASALDRQPNAAYRARREALAKKTDGGAVVIFAPLERDDEVYGFRQENNFYYLTGYDEPAAALLIAPAREAKDTIPARPYAEILFLPAHNTVQEKWTGPKLGPDDPDAKQRTGFDQVEVLDKLRDELSRLIPPRGGVVYSDLAAYGEASASTEGLDWLKRANAFLGHVSFQDAKPLMASLRTIKDPGEIELLRKAVDASAAAHLAAMKAMKPGINEHDISALMQYEWNKRGCDRPAYAPIVGTGFNSTVLHYSADDAPIQNGDIVVIDAAGEYAMYASDITRTLPANGKFTTRQREIYDIVYGAQQAAMNAFVSGKSKLTGRDDPNSLFKVAFEYINTHGKDSHGEPLGKYFIHGLGHYVGLDVHDAGDYTIPLAPGMVFTIEPGIYIPEEKLGVRIEDDYWVDPSGKLVKLSGSLPSTADEVEKAMTGR
jgi:Xaa-Pro aminopeptidase